MYGPLLVLFLDLVVCAAANTHCECQCMEVNHNITTTSLPGVVHPQLVADARVSFPQNPLLPLSLFFKVFGVLLLGVMVWITVTNCLQRYTRSFGAKDGAFAYMIMQEVN